MKTILLLLFSITACLQLNAQAFQKTPFGIKATIEDIDIEVQFFDQNTVRITKAPGSGKYTKESLSVIAKPKQTELKVVHKGTVLQIKSSRLAIKIDLKTGIISFSTANGKALLTEKNAPVFSDFNDAGSLTYRVKQNFLLDQEEPIYGLGILQNGKMSQRNQTRNLVQGNVEDVVPFFQSVKGYGIFWDNYSPTVFSDKPGETFFESEVGDLVDYYFMYGENADGVIAQMRNLTGQVPMFPLWTYGYWQSRERYKSQKELLEVVNKYRDLGVPLDGIIQDWQYWGNNYLWNAMEFLNPEFPKPQQMVDEVHAKNAHLIISIWSSFGPQTKPYRELNEKNLLFNFKTWPESGLETWPPNKEYPSGVRVYDAYSPVARDIYWKNLSRLHKMKIDGWWMDSSEPDHLDWKPEDMDTKTYLGSFRKVRNAYPLMSVGGVYENQRKVSSDKRVFILTRSAFAGQQRYGANTWSGDVGSSWESLRKQVPAGLNFSLTGIPHWNSDLGGFFAGHYNKSWSDGTASKNPAFQELYVRWLQQGTFTPMMRSHGTDTPREIYYFGKKGEPVYDAIEKFINIRYRLLPYIYSTSWEVTNKQSSFLRALVMDFAHDKNVWDINDQYMFGKALLVAPIVKAQYTPEEPVKVNEADGWNKQEDKYLKSGNSIINFAAQKTTEVYLPAGTIWYDFWTNQRFNGGKKLSQATSIDMIPIYVKAGSIIPFGPQVQYATEKPWDALEIKVYTGANGSFILYEDEFDNYNYEKGAYTEIPIHWNDAARTLTLGKRQGSYTGMLEQRTFTITLQDGTKKTVDYNGSSVIVKMK